MWVFGPFPCGTFSDVKIFRWGLEKVLCVGEYVLTDRAYQDNRYHSATFSNCLGKEGSTGCQSEL